MTTDLDIQLTSTGDNPLVGVVMGSDSDWPTMEAAVGALAEFGIACEVGVVSAHRMPEDMVAYGRSASKRGLRVIIAGAGGAAHLPGMLAALTELPVIGVPVPLKHLDGVDSLHSIVQMPAGVPVATVSIAGATRDCWPPGSSEPARVNGPRPCAPRCATSRRTFATWPAQRVRPSPSASPKLAEAAQHKHRAGSREGAARRILKP